MAKLYIALVGFLLVASSLAQNSPFGDKQGAPQPTGGHEPQPSGGHEPQPTAGQPQPAGPNNQTPPPASGANTVVPILNATGPSSSKHTGHNGATSGVAVASSLILVCLAPVFF